MFGLAAHLIPLLRFGLRIKLLSSVSAALAAGLGDDGLLKNLQLLEHAIAVLGAKRDQLQSTTPISRVLGGLRFFEHAVKVTATESKGAHRGAARVRGLCSPRPRTSVDIDRRASWCE